MNILSFKYLIGEREERIDTVKDLVSTMNILVNQEHYEDAKFILDVIKKELKPVFKYEWSPSKLGDIQTFKDISDMLLSNSIRITPEQIEFVNYLDLIISLSERKDELQGIKSFDINRIRRVIAEELLCLGISINAKRKGFKGKMPNRSLLNIAYNVHPDICRKELSRREYVNLWKAFENNDKKEMIKIKHKIREYNSLENR